MSTFILSGRSVVETNAGAETIPLLEAQLAEARTDAAKVKALNALAWELCQREAQRALFLGTEALSLAKASPDQAGRASSLCVTGACMAILSRYGEAREALAEALALSRRIGDLDTEARCLHYFGVVHYYLAEHAEAIERVTAGLKIREDQQDWKGLAGSFIMLGNIQFCLCDYSQALDWYQRGLEAAEQTGEQRGIGQAMGNIGSIYGIQGNFTEALRFHQRGFDLSVRTGDMMLQVSDLSNLSCDYVALGRYEEAVTACRQAVTLGEKLENWKQVSVALSNMGDAYDKLGRQAEALECCAHALKIARSDQNLRTSSDCLFFIGRILLRQGALDEARKHLAEAAALAQTIKSRYTALEAFKALSEACKRQGDYAAALGHYETFQRLEKEVFSEEADKRAKALAVQMEVEHHRREAETLSEINAALSASNAALSEANARLESLATTDPLTSLPNHRALVAALDALIARARRDSRPCALLFLDIDHFKSINDTYGHPTGDAVLREFAGGVRSCLRPHDTLGRWGGEEFLVLLPDTDLAGAMEAGERVRAAVASRPLADDLQVTCSLGAATCPPQEASRDALVSAADQALYAAKRLGRNQVRGAGDPAILALDGSIPEGEPVPLQGPGFHASATRQTRLPDEPALRV